MYSSSAIIGDLATSRVVSCPEGITRATVIEICAAEKIRCVETDLSVVDVYGADEMFCTGTMGELAAVTKIDNRVIGDGKVGADHKTPERSLRSTHCERRGTGRLVVRLPTDNDSGVVQ